MTSPQRPHLTEVSPFFIVRELRDSVAFYRDRLGFHVDRPNYRFPLRDPDQLFEELRPQLAQVDHTPCADTPWGTRELHLRDPDGNGLQFYRVR